MNLRIASSLILVGVWGGCRSMEDAAMAEVAEFDGQQIAYRVQGTAKRAIVFVHGWAGDRSHWHHQFDGLDLERRLLAVDLLGHGDSGKPVGDYSMGRLAGGVAAAMDAAGIERAILVGHSNGVPVARELLRMHPERVEAIVAVDGPFRAPLTPGVAAWMRETLAAPDFEPVARMMADQMPRGGLGDADFARLQEGIVRTPRHVHAGGLAAMTDPQTWREDPIGVPLLVVRAGGAQRDPDEAAFVRTLAADVEYHVFEGVGHAIPMECPARFNALLTDFVRRLDRGE